MELRLLPHAPLNQQQESPCLDRIGTRTTILTAIVLAGLIGVIANDVQRTPEAISPSIWVGKFLTIVISAGIPCYLDRREQRQSRLCFLVTAVSLAIIMSILVAGSVRNSDFNPTMIGVGLGALTVALVSTQCR